MSKSIKDLVLLKHIDGLSKECSFSNPSVEFESKPRFHFEGITMVCEVPRVKASKLYLIGVVIGDRKSKMSNFREDDHNTDSNKLSNVYPDNDSFSFVAKFYNGNRNNKIQNYNEIEENKYNDQEISRYSE